ncbi:MAG: putative porin, partial [Leptospiraceae bacterium]|nr:putative porin [Leptospiraceae bacterium]
VRTLNKSRDEDFAMGQVTVERGRKFSLLPPFLYDTAHTFSGTVNFADGIAKSTVSEYSLHFGIKYYFSRELSERESHLGLFLISEPSYAYFKYLLYDVMQFVNRPLFYGPIGIGLSYTHSFSEIPLGLGYTSKHQYFQLELSLQLLVNYFKYRDFHYQRNLNFLGNGAGSGFIYQFILQIPLGHEVSLKLNYRGHRMFGMSPFNAKGGLVESDVLSNFYGKFHSYITTKESSVNISIDKTFQK